MLFWKTHFFQKCGSSETFDAAYLLEKSISSVDIFILNNSSARKVAVPKSNYPKELPILKWWLGRSFSLSSRKSSYSGKITAAKKGLFLKRSSSKKVDDLKKQLLRKSNYCVKVITLKKYEEVASPKIKLSWKSRNICRKANRHLKKKSQIKLLIPFN